MLRLPEPQMQNLRARERHRRIALSAAASGCARGVSVLTTLISVPLALSYLGVDRYGLWMTITSLALLLGFADLGLGNGLLNAIADADGKGDRALGHRLVSTAFFMLIGLAAGLGLLCSLVYPWIPWARVFNVSASPAAVEAGPSLAVFAFCTIVGVPLTLVQRVQLGYQEGFSNSLWQILGSVFSILGLFATIAAKASLPWLVLSVAGGPVLAMLFQGIVVFGGRYKDLRPRWNLVAGSIGRRLAGDGLLFLVLQLAVALAFASDAVIAAQVLGPDAVAEYSVAARLFSIPAVLVAMAVGPLWPAYREAITRGDAAWVRLTLRRSLFVAVLGSTLPAICLVVLGVPLVRWWAGSEVVPSTSLLAALAFWAVLQAGGSAVSMFLNGASIVKAQVVCASLMATAAVILKVILIYSIGLPGVVWGTIAAYIVFVLFPYLVIVPKLLSALRTGAHTQ